MTKTPTKRKKTTKRRLETLTAQQVNEALASMIDTAIRVIPQVNRPKVTR